MFPLAIFIDPPVEDKIRLAWEEIMGYVARVTYRTAFADDVTVFVIFLAVRSLLQQRPSILKEQRRTDTSR